MARDGSGNYSLPAGNPVGSGSVIQSSWANQTLNDIAAALTASLSKDGQTAAAANLPMGGFKHTNVAVAAALTDYARADQVQRSAFCLLSSVSGTDAISATLPLSASTFAVGQMVALIPVGANTGAVTLAINGGVANQVRTQFGSVLAANDLLSGACYQLMWDGSVWRIVSVVSSQLGGVLLAVNNLADVANVAAARTSLGLGTAALQASSAFVAAGTAALVANNLSDVTASTARNNLGLGTAAQQASSAFVAAGTAALVANNLSDVTAATARTNLGLTDGQYTPTYTAGTNVVSLTAHPANYHRVGNTVFVTTVVDVTCTAAGGAASDFGMSLVAAQTVALTTDISGVAVHAGVPSAAQQGVVSGDTGNNRAKVSWNTTNTSFSFSLVFSYKVN
jgi:hypothetical protein